MISTPVILYASRDGDHVMITRATCDVKPGSYEIFPVILHSPMVQNRHTHRTHSVHCSASPGPCAALQSRRPSALLTPSRPAFAVMPLERASNASISPTCAVARPKGAVYASPPPPPASMVQPPGMISMKSSLLRRFHLRGSSVQKLRHASASI